jgi:hypothetical protein
MDGKNAVISTETSRIFVREIYLATDLASLSLQVLDYATIEVIQYSINNKRFTGRLHFHPARPKHYIPVLLKTGLTNF